MGLCWTDARIVAEELYDLEPDVHPLEIRFTDLHQKVLALEGFSDAPEASSEKLLEAIQMIWYEEWKEDHESEEDPYSR